MISTPAHHRERLNRLENHQLPKLEVALAGLPKAWYVIIIGNPYSNTESDSVSLNGTETLHFLYLLGHLIAAGPEATF